MLAKVSCALVLALVVAHVSAQDKDLQGGSSSVVPSYQSLTGDPDINRDGGSYAPASYGSHDYGYDGGDSYGASGYGDSLGGFVHALTAFLPIGLFLAAVVPNVITVNGGRRRRSNEDEVNEEVTFPILDMISSYGMRSLQDPGCQAKITCELGAMGGLPEANGLQRSLWIAANYVPERLAGIAGAARLMRSIQKRDCTEFACGTD